jgi:hypothetical protein
VPVLLAAWGTPLGVEAGALPVGEPAGEGRGRVASHAPPSASKSPAAANSLTSAILTAEA